MTQRSQPASDSACSLSCAGQRIIGFKAATSDARKLAIRLESSEVMLTAQNSPLRSSPRSEVRSEAKGCSLFLLLQ